MKNRLRFIAIIVLTLATVNHVTGQTTTRFVANFDSDWKFFPGDTTNAYETNFNDNAWRLLDLPPSGKDINNDPPRSQSPVNSSLECRE